MNPPLNPSEPSTQAPTPSGIAERQNGPHRVEWVAAQRQLYANDKRRTTIWFVVSTLIAVIGTGVLVSTPQYIAVLNWIALVIGLVELWILPRLRDKREMAARIQEQFDCEVLKLPWNDAAVRQPDPKAIELAVRDFKKRKNQVDEWKHVANWYENGYIHTAPLHQVRVACLNENVVWDAGQRRQFSLWIHSVLGGYGIVLVVVSLIGQWQVQQLFSGHVWLTLPIVLTLAKIAAEHIQAANRLDQLKMVLENLWQDAQRSTDDTSALLQRTRDLQTEIYRHRANDTPIPDWVYKLLKPRNQPAQAKTNSTGSPTSPG